MVWSNQAPSSLVFPPGATTGERIVIGFDSTQNAEGIFAYNASNQLIFSLTDTDSGHIGFLPINPGDDLTGNIWWQDNFLVHNGIYVLNDPTNGDEMVIQGGGKTNQKNPFILLTPDNSSNGTGGSVALEHGNGSSNTAAVVVKNAEVDITSSNDVDITSSHDVNITTTTHNIYLSGGNQIQLNQASSYFTMIANDLMLENPQGTIHLDATGLITLSGQTEVSIGNNVGGGVRVLNTDFEILPTTTLKIDNQGVVGNGNAGCALTVVNNASVILDSGASIDAKSGSAVTIEKGGTFQLGNGVAGGSVNQLWNASTSLSFPSGSYITLTGWTVGQSDSDYSMSLSGGQATIPLTGWYDLSWSFRFDYGVANTRVILLSLLNGSTDRILDVYSAQGNITMAYTDYMFAGDTIGAQLNQLSGTTQHLTNGFWTLCRRL